MTSFGAEPNSHVFIIRARREPREIPGARPEWRFWIEHHPSGEQRNLRDFGSVLAFIRSYLPDLELPADRWEAVRRLLVPPIDTRRPDE